MSIVKTIEKARNIFETVSEEVGFEIGLKQQKEELEKNKILLWYKHLTNLTASNKQAYGVYNVESIEEIKQGDGIVLYNSVSLLFSYFSRDNKYGEILEKLEKKLADDYRAKIIFLNDNYNTDLKLHYITFKIILFIYE